MRADWRRRRAQLVGLVIVVGVAGAVVLTALAGARRTSTSFERLAREIDAADVAVDLGGAPDAVVDEIAALPIVEQSGWFTVVFALVEGVEADLGMWIPRDDRMGVEIERFRVLRGRAPDPARPEEVLINETAAALAGVDVGDEVEIATLTPEQVRAEEYFPPRGPLLALEVVGLVRGIDDIVEGAEGGFFASPALYEVVRGRVDEFTTYLTVDLADGSDAADFDAAVADLLPADQEHQSLSLDQRSRAARGTISAVSSGLAVFALVAAAASTVAMGQAVGRHISGARSDLEVLHALGVTALGRVEALVWLAVPVAVAGAVLAGVGAWLASPLMPMGLARRAEPDPGLAWDWIALVGGGLAIIVTVLVAAAVAAGWLTMGNRGGHRRQPSALAEVLGRAGAGPVTTNGARLALDRRPPALAVRSALAGVSVAILGVVAVITFSASLDRLVETPERWGYRWDLLLNFTSAEVHDGAARLSEDERVSAAATWDAGFSYVEGSRVRAYGLRPLIGEIGFALRSGRQPLTPGEVVLGADLAERLRVDVGDRVEVGPSPDATDTAPLVVVGTSLFPDDGEGSFTGAIGYFDSAFADHATAPHLFEASQVVVRLRPGIDVQSTTAALEADYPEAVSAESIPIAPHQVSNLGSVRSLPRWLAGFLAGLGTVSLLHVLITTLRRRPGELATLRALGITPRQAGACILWQSLTITAIGLAAGLPLGLIAGDAAWFAITDPTGVATDADRPALLHATVGVLALLISIIVAIAPGRRAGRLRLADALRTG